MCRSFLYEYVKSLNCLTFVEASLNTSVLILCKPEALLSLTALVAGMTNIRVSKTHTCDLLLFVQVKVIKDSPEAVMMCTLYKYISKCAEVILLMNVAFMCAIEANIILHVVNTARILHFIVRVILTILCKNKTIKMHINSLRPQ